MFKTEPLRSDNDYLAWYRTTEAEDPWNVCCVSRVLASFPEVKDKNIQLCIAPQAGDTNQADVPAKAIASFADFNISQYLSDLFRASNISHEQPIYWWVEEAP